MTPGSLAFPIIECVLPEPVWPYAKIVPLKPSKRPSHSGSAMSVNTDSEDQSPGSSMSWSPGAKSASAWPSRFW